MTEFSKEDAMQVLIDAVQDVLDRESYKIERDYYMAGKKLDDRIRKWSMENVTDRLIGALMREDDD